MPLYLSSWRSQITPSEGSDKTDCQYIDQLDIDNDGGDEVITKQTHYESFDYASGNTIRSPNPGTRFTPVVVAAADEPGRLTRMPVEYASPRSSTDSMPVLLLTTVCVLCTPVL